MYFEKYGMKYWDDFERRASECVKCILNNEYPPIRRISIHITNICNFKCQYCNEYHQTKTMEFQMYSKIIREYSEIGGGIIHITGGEPSTIKNFMDYITESSKYNNIDFHLNTNLYRNVIPDDLFKIIKRLKVSLDTSDANYFNHICGVKNAFEKVTENLDYIHDLIKRGITDTLVSLTYTVTRQNFRLILGFLRMYYKRWPKFYATFFSSYKGINSNFVFQDSEIEELFNVIVPKMNEMTNQYNDHETKMLFNMSHGKETFIQGDRFPNNSKIPCYLCLSEMCIDEDGYIWNCSHLFRDKIPNTGLNVMDDHLSSVAKQAKRGISIPVSPKCLYGCNKKLMTYNMKVHENLQFIIGLYFNLY